MAAKDLQKDYSAEYSEDSGINLTISRPPIISNTHLPRPTMFQPPTPTTRSSQLGNTRSLNGPINATHNTLNSSHQPNFFGQHQQFYKTQSNTTQQQQVLVTSNELKDTDGSTATLKRESTLDTALLFQKLKQVEDERRAMAMNTLNEHYKSVFNYHVRINYRLDQRKRLDKDVYVVQITENTLKAVRDKLPIKGDFRYFFRGEDNEYIEIENDRAIVPYDEKDGKKYIQCSVFPN